MSSNQNRFIDRFPTILTAGQASDSLGDSVAGCFRHYNIDEALGSLQHAAHRVPERAPARYPPEPYANRGRPGIFTEVRPCMRPNNKTTYEILVNELKETTYESHWNKTLGHCRWAVPGLPKGFDPLAKPFGRSTVSDISVRELVNPPKTSYQVLEDSQIAHDKYVLSHEDYNPGEQIKRRYQEPYDPHKRYGMKTKYDARGIWAKCCCHWQQSDPIVFMNKVQADFNLRHRGRLAKVLEPNRIREQLPEEHTYGTPMNRDLYGVEELLRDNNCPPCLFKQDLKCWLSSFNRLYETMKKKCNSPTGGLNYDDLYKKLLYYDEEKTHRLPLKTFYEVCACAGLYFDHENLEQLLKLVQIVVDDIIDYPRFLDMLDYKQPPVELRKFHDIPVNNQYYLTTSQASLCDYLMINNADMPPAGVPSARIDRNRPKAPDLGCRADIEHLGEYTTTGLLLNPSIFVNYGLNYRDFFLPREKSVIKKLFEKVGYVFDDNGGGVSFEKLWKMGQEFEKDDLVCVETFSNLLKQHYPKSTKLVVDEVAC